MAQVTQEKKRPDAHVIRITPRAYQELVRRQTARLKVTGTRPSLVDTVDEALFGEKK